MNALNYHEIELIEPRLADVRAAIIDWRDHGGEKECREIEKEWHYDFKNKFIGLVGLLGENIDPRLRNTAAYDVVYHEFERLLPDCRCASCQS